MATGMIASRPEIRRKMSTISLNPFIVGNPMKSREMFFCREDDFLFVARWIGGGQSTGKEFVQTEQFKELRSAMALHQALVKYGLKYWAGPKSAYKTIPKAKSTVDYLQFHAQTIQL
jgi:hypothetical protein